MMNNEEAYSLMVKQLAGEANAAEQEELNVWLAGSSVNQEAFNELSLIWNNAEKDNYTPDVEAAWEKVNKQTAPKVIGLFNRRFLAVAALITAVSLTGALFIKQMNVSVANVATAAHEMKQVDLPDGSKVWLHEFSELSYENGLKGAERVVKLKGMAFFDVHRDEAHPFVIETPKGEVRVLGTSFEVLAFEKDTFERVTVSTGKVQFRSKSGGELILTVNDEGVISKSGFADKHQVDAQTLTSWHASKLEFSNDTMEKVAEKLERFFHIKVSFKNADIKNCHFTGSYEHPKLNEILDALSRALQVTYAQQADRVTFDGAGCKPSK